MEDESMSGKRILDMPAESPKKAQAPSEAKIEAGKAELMKSEAKRS